jgi:hypothetical protein
VRKAEASVVCCQFETEPKRSERPQAQV